MSWSLCGLGVSVFGMFLVSVAKLYHKFDDSKARRFLFLLGATFLSVFAATKPSTQFYFAVGLQDDGSYTTNNFVHIEWVKTGAPYVPNTSTVFIDYRHRESTNEWIELAEVPVTRYFFDTTIENATSLVFNVWWHNEENEVHTNGVWVYKAVQSKSTTSNSNSFDIIPTRAAMTVNGKIVAPPSRKE
jgi:hypothetical protein